MRSKLIIKNLIENKKPDFPLTSIIMKPLEDAKIN